MCSGDAGPRVMSCSSISAMEFASSCTLHCAVSQLPYGLPFDAKASSSAAVVVGLAGLWPPLLPHKGRLCASPLPGFVWLFHSCALISASHGILVQWGQTMTCCRICDTLSYD